MKKVLCVMTLVFAIVGCSSGSTKNLNIHSKENFEMENVNSGKKPLDEIIVFNEQGVTIRKDGNNLILSMEERILFDFNKSEIKNKVKPALNALSKALIDNDDIRIKIDGFTDNIGSDMYNLELSLKRANAIKEYLMLKEVPENNVTVEGMGVTKALNANATDEERSINRRVEFIISRAY